MDLPALPEVVGVTRECDVCGDDLPTPDVVEVGDGRVCPECHGTLFVDGSTETAETESADDRSPALEAFADAVEFFYEQLDRPIDDHQSGGHADRPDTGREYFERVRGWDTETVDAKRLGWAPADETALLDYLMSEGYDRDAILGTGLFTEDLTPLWQGRFVFPYFDVDGRPVYAISRSTGSEGGGAAGYDGHPADFMSGKYAKPAHTKEYVVVDEPIYGLETVEPDEPVLVTEGIADAITAHECGYACISPVTTQFKHRDRERLVDILENRDVKRVYVVQDAERPTSDVDEEERLTLEQFGPGMKGGVATASYLADHGVDAHVAELPRPGLDKVDLDDYLGTWARDLSSVLASAKPAEAHPAHEPEAVAVQTAAEDRTTIESSSRSSALFDLGITDVTGLSSGYRGTNPLGHHGHSENYFVLVDGAEVAYDHKYGVAYNALTFLLCEAGVRSPSTPNGSLDDEELFAAWRYAKRRGLIPDDDPIPHAALRYVAVENGFCAREDIEDGWRLPVDAYRAALDHVRNEHGVDPGRSGGTGSVPTYTTVFPPAVRDLTVAASGWDWRHAGQQDEGTLTVSDARERTVDAIADAYTSYDQVLIEALPTMGKSYGAIKAAADTGEQVTVLTGRGHKEQYDQLREWCAEHDLDYCTLPSFTRDCDTANGEHGQEWADTVRGWYSRGATPKEIHKSAEYVLDQPLPCQEHDGQRCPYASKWDFEPDEYDVLIGHYNHAHKTKVTAGRTVVFDEFPDAYETLLGPELQGAISCWLDTVDDLPFDSYTDLVENRGDERRRADALLWFDENGIERDETHVFDDPSAHAAAPLAVFTLLASDDLENGFERATIEDVGIGVFDRAQGGVSVLQPPAFEYASGVVALDGTPTKRMWELALGTRLNHRSVLQDDERAEYIRDALNLNLVRTSEYVKPYNSPDHVNTDLDAALLEKIGEKHGEQPSVITTTTAEREYDAEGVVELVDETKHYGNVLGSNEFDDVRLGVLIGSNHYGDGYIKKWGAYAGEAVERGDGKGTDLSYGGFGDRVLTHMREHDTLQAAMRFGRDGNGAVVYVHTDTLPEWVPLAGEGRVLTTWSPGMREVIDAAADLEEWRTDEIARRVSITERQVREHLHTLRKRGYLEARHEGRGFTWCDTGLHRVSVHGEVDLEPIDFDELSESEVAEVARNSIYTWKFRNPWSALGGDARSKRTNGGDYAATVDRSHVEDGPPPG